MVLKMLKALYSCQNCLWQIASTENLSFVASCLYMSISHLVWDLTQETGRAGGVYQGRNDSITDYWATPNRRQYKGCPRVRFCQFCKPMQHFCKKKITIITWCISRDQRSGGQLTGNYNDPVVQ